MMMGGAHHKSQPRGSGFPSKIFHYMNCAMLGSSFVIFFYHNLKVLGHSFHNNTWWHSVNILKYHFKTSTSTHLGPLTLVRIIHKFNLLFLWYRMMILNILFYEGGVILHEKIEFHK